MRIISGDLKGKKLSAPLDKSTRPLKDMVRESIFNIINHSNKVSKKICSSINKFKIIVTKSTVPVTTGDEIEKILSKKIVKRNFLLFQILNF